MFTDDILLQVEVDSPSPETTLLQFLRSIYIFFSKTHEEYIACLSYSILGVVMVVIVWLLDLQLPVQLVPIIINVVSSKPVHGEVYLIQHNVIKFISAWISPAFFFLL